MPAKSSQVPGETVRVPLTLAALRRVRPYAGVLVRRQGLQLRVVAARDTGLALDFSPFGLPGGVTLTDARGRAVPLRPLFRMCSSGFAVAGRLPCRERRETSLHRFPPSAPRPARSRPTR